MRTLWSFVASLIVVVGFWCGSCVPQPGPTPVPSAYGGAPAGGAPSEGGSIAQGGWLPLGRGGAYGGQAGAATGGAMATGGTTATTIDWLACATTERASMASQHRNLSGWHRNPNRPHHARWRAMYAAAAVSNFPQPNVAIALNQGTRPSCTGNGTAQCLSTWPFTAKLTEADAIRIYEKATQIDPFPGTDPPDPTGSDGASAARAAKILGYTSFDFASVDTLSEVKQALQLSTGIIGVDWWSGFSTPQRCGEMQLTGSIEGGHEIQLAGFDAEMNIYIIRNSWGPTWGRCRTGKHASECGYAYWTAATLQKLLDGGAEIDFPVMQ
jgi:hypothetical protein